MTTQGIFEAMLGPMKPGDAETAKQLWPRLADAVNKHGVNGRVAVVTVGGFYLELCQLYGVDPDVLLLELQDAKASWVPR